MKKTIRSEGSFGPEQVERLRTETASFLALSRIPGPQAYSIITVVDEVACNILEHAHASFLELEIKTSLAVVELLFRDDGVAFDPTAKVLQQAALMPGDAEERKLGLYMVANLGDGLRYERVDGINELSIVLPASDPAESANAMSLEIQPGLDGKPWRVSPTGKVDVFSFTRLKKALEDISGQDPTAKIAVDLEHVSYIASSGWSVLLARRRLMRQVGGDLVVYSLPAEIRRVYTAMKITRLLPTAPDLAAATQLLGAAKP